MRFASFEVAGRRSFGAVVDGGVVDLGARMGKITSLRDALAAGVVEAAKESAAGLAPDIALEDVALLPTVPDAEKYICVGVNYANRNAEYNDRSEQPKYPSLFMRAAESFVGHDCAITGAGVRFDPPRWLAPGDRLEISCPAIGVLANTVIDEAV